MKNSKKDKKLGEKVHEYLLKYGVETPMTDTYMHPDAVAIIADRFKDIMYAIGLDLNDDSLKGTPLRIGRMFAFELFYGLDYRHFPKCTTVENKMKYDEMICVKDAKISSVCEHHFVTIDGVAKVAYIPKDTVLGLSKINRIVDFFSRRPQIQERLTEQIFFALSYVLDTEDIAVRIDAVHHCVKQRGIMDVNSHTLTQKLGGAFRNDLATRNEFIKF